MTPSVSVLGGFPPAHAPKRIRELPPLPNGSLVRGGKCAGRMGYGISPLTPAGMRVEGVSVD